MEGGDNVLANMFKGIGLIGLIGGILLVIMANVGYPDWNTGIAVEVDSLEAGALFTVMGVGFMLFGAMIKRESWEQAVN